MEQEVKKVTVFVQQCFLLFAFSASFLVSKAQLTSPKAFSVAMSGVLSNYGYGAGFRFERKFSYLQSWSLRSQWVRDASSPNAPNAWSLAPGYCNLYPIAAGLARIGAFWEVGVLQTQVPLSPEEPRWFTAPFAELSYAFPIWESRCYAFSSVAFGRRFILSSSADAAKKWNHQVTTGIYWNWGVR